MVSNASHSLDFSAPFPPGKTEKRPEEEKRMSTSRKRKIRKSQSSWLDNNERPSFRSKADKSSAHYFFAVHRCCGGPPVKTKSRVSKTQSRKGSLPRRDRLATGGFLTLCERSFPSSIRSKCERAAALALRRNGRRTPQPRRGRKCCERSSFRSKPVDVERVDRDESGTLVVDSAGDCASICEELRICLMKTSAICACR